MKGEAWRELVEGTDEEEGFAPRLERMWREQDYLHPRARLGYFPCNADGNELVVFDPEDPERELERLVFPRQPKHDRICLADFFRPIDSGERDVVALQGVTVGPEVTELIERLESEGEFAEQLYVHGLGVQSAEGLAEWLHSEVRRELGIDLDQGRRYSWGYPACPDQSEHEKVWRLLGLEEIGMTLSDGYAVMPEQSTVAIIAHHPQAVYFGMKSGFIPEGKVARRADRRHRARRRAAAGVGARRGAEGRGDAGRGLRPAACGAIDPGGDSRCRWDLYVGMVAGFSPPRRRNSRDRSARRRASTAWCRRAQLRGLGSQRRPDRRALAAGISTGSSAAPTRWAIPQSANSGRCRRRSSPAARATAISHGSAAALLGLTERIPGADPRDRRGERGRRHPRHPLAPGAGAAPG